jgi:hypothetical protein
LNFSAVDKHGITSPDRYLVAMMTDGQFNAFVSKLQAEQQALRRELAPYEAGKIRVLSGPSGGPKDDITAERTDARRKTSTPTFGKHGNGSLRSCCSERWSKDSTRT